MTIDQIKAVLYDREASAPILYQPIEHEAFDDWQIKQPCIERWAMIRSHLPDSGDLVVDLGCHTGWFCRQFARAGWVAIGIDRSKEWINAARSLSDLLEVPVGYRIGDVVNDDVPSCDVALLLSTAMYLFDDEALGWSAMRRISEAAPVLFFDYGGMYADRIPPDFTEALVRETAYARVQKIGVSDFEQRPLYMAQR